MKAARQKGLCDTGKDIIRHADVDEIIRQYRDHLGWHVTHDNPPEDILRKHYAGFCTDWVAVGAEAAFADQSKVLLTCDAKGVVTYSEKKRGRVFVRHGATLELTAAKGAMVVVSMYDDCIAHIEAAEGARVYVFLHDVARLEDTPTDTKEIVISKR